MLHSKGFIWNSQRCFDVLFQAGVRTEREWFQNEYDPCVANKVVNSKQMTITRHVDDAKISQMDREVVE